MQLKVGQLAQRSGLTVRALHHYDSIGLLTPSARSAAGYRLYGHDDIVRLHQIQALRRLGLALAEIGAMLSQSPLPFATIVARQIAMLDQQIDQAHALRVRLQQLQRQLAAGQQPALADLLTNLELMTMYDKYFTPHELDQLAFARPGSTESLAWPALVAQVQALLDGGIAPETAQAGALAMRWMAALERDTKGDPRLLVKLNAMHQAEPALQVQTGITPALGEFVQRAYGAARLALYANYLTPEEITHMRTHAAHNARNWPPLIGEARCHMAAGTAPQDAQLQELARRWQAQFNLMAGNDPGTRARMRMANENEPQLLVGTFIDLDLLAYMRSAIDGLPQG